MPGGIEPRSLLPSRPQLRWRTAAAKELEEALAKGLTEVLTLEEAAAESGYSADHLGRLLADGTIPNAGRKYALGSGAGTCRGSRRRRRPDPSLPRPPGGPSLARITRDAISSRTGRR